MWTSLTPLVLAAAALLVVAAGLGVGCGTRPTRGGIRTSSLPSRERQP